MDLHAIEDPDGPVDWVLSRSVEDPDVMWAFEFYRDDASFDRHYSNPALDDGHQKVMDLLADGVGQSTFGVEHYTLAQGQLGEREGAYETDLFAGLD